MGTSFLFFFVVFLLLLSFGTSNNMMSSSNVTCIHGEWQSLVIFKQSLTNGLNRLSTWTGLECCEWHGVQCDRGNGHVVKLDLRNPLLFTGDTLYNGNWLGGELSPSLMSLKHLRYLDLSMNNFSGQIPEFLGSFKRLEYLNLSCSGFGGVVPHHLGNLSKLQYLDLNYIVEENGRRDRYNGSELHSYDLWWVSSLSSLNHLDLSGVIIGRNNIDWFQSVNMLPSLLTLNMAFCRINLHSVKFVNLTSLYSLDLSTNVINTTVPFWLSNLTSLMHLKLQYNFFHGQIPDSLGTLSSLASFDLSVNKFNTLMPGVFWKISGLVHLDLSSNMFYGSIPSYVKLCNLSVLNLSNNEFEGDLSNFIGNALDCSLGRVLSLRELDISFNKFKGSIPTSFGLLSRLEKLNLRDNHLSGNIPMSLMQLSRLEKLDVSYNSLVGILSELHFAKLKNLTFLSLSSNSLALSFSSGWLPPFQLQRFSVGSCNIGPSFPNWLQTQENLQVLDLSNSSIRDTIPEWFENISSHIYDLDLSHNQIGGKLPQFQSSINLSMPFSRYIVMNSNKFEGLSSLPSNMRLLDLSDNLLSGHVPQIDGTMNPQLSVINLSKNRFTGSIPIHLCTVLSIRVLDLSQNKFSGKLPRCLRYLNGLAIIDFSDNTITGVVPSWLGSLEDLRSLHLQNNRFNGSLPVSLQNLIGLTTMDLSNNLLTGDIPLLIGENLWSALGILNLRSNMFTGKIPLQLCDLNMLQFLDLAQNDITGTIPHCLANLWGMIRNNNYLLYTDEYYEENVLASMKGMRLLYTKTSPLLTSLDLSSNNIVGEIPDVLMNLVGLRNLNLSRNMLTGKIPMMVGNLKRVESLDLSMNKLSGPIPPSLSLLYSLSHLNLSFNNLSGAIPVGNQIQTLNDPSIYEGNNGLCGAPLSRTCKSKSNNGSYNHIGKDEGGDNDHESFWFYAGMGPGFFIGFIGLIGSLHFIRAWRLAYFGILEILYNWLMLSILLNLARLKRKLF